MNGIIYKQMMTELRRQLTVIKEANKVTSEQIMCQTERSAKMLKSSLHATKEIKESKKL